jgi:type III secretion protein V
VPWTIEVAEDLRARVPAIVEHCSELRATLFAELGVPFPAPRVQAGSSLPRGQARVLFFEVPTGPISIPAGTEAVQFLTDEAAARLRARASDFVGIAETQRLLGELERIDPALVRSVVPKPITVPLLADVLRRLVEERVGIRDLRAILEALATMVPTEKDPLALSEHVRTNLRRPITFRLTGGADHLAVYLLDPLIEDTVRRAVTRTPGGAFLALPPASARDLVASVARAFDESPPPHGAPRVVLTQPDIRRFVRKLLDGRFPDAEVVSFAELLPELALRPLARANLIGV